MNSAKNMDLPETSSEKWAGPDGTALLLDAVSCEVHPFSVLTVVLQKHLLLYFSYNVYLHLL
jgi:hypothetical protein